MDKLLGDRLRRTVVGDPGFAQFEKIGFVFVGKNFFTGAAAVLDGVLARTKLSFGGARAGGRPRRIGTTKTSPALSGGTSSLRLDGTGRKLIFGAVKRTPGSYVISSGPKVTAAEGLGIQRLGVRIGCHSCGTKIPRFTYHADHIVQQEFCTSYMERVFDRLGLDYPEEFELRP